MKMEKELNEKEFTKRIENELKNYEILKTMFQKIFESDSNLSEKRNSVFEKIENIDESDSETLKNIYTSFTKEMKDLENIRKKQENIHGNIIGAIEYDNYKAKMYKKQVGKYKDIKGQTEKQEREISKLRVSGNDEKAKQIDEDLKKSKNQMEEIGKSLEDDFVKFEIDRIMNNKYLFLHFIYSEMNYHAKSLEKLTPLYKEINETNTKLDMKEFMESLNINQDPENYGYDEREDMKRSKNKSIKESNFTSSVKPSLKISGLGKSKKTKKSVETVEEEEIGSDDEQ